MQGMIKRLIKDKKFGFILGEDRREYFFHMTAVKNAQFDDLQEEQEVTFEEVEGSKGPRAEDIFI